jgi:hypothetical protein
LYSRTNSNQYDEALKQPAHAKTLFLKSILNGGACPVGYADEQYIAIHCCPPIPVFPRDFPDTIEGEKYWNNTSEPWNYIRQYWDSGGGRVRVSTSASVQSPKSINLRPPNFLQLSRCTGMIQTHQTNDDKIQTRQPA